MYKILVPVDGSEHADRAIGAVARLAQHATGIEAVLINVREGWISHGDLLPLEYKSMEEGLVVQQDEVLKRALSRASQCGLRDVVCEAVRGQVAEEIIGAADTHAVDQIAMGTHGRGAVGNLFIGSIAQQVLHMAQVPVMFVKWTRSATRERRTAGMLNAEMGKPGSSNRRRSRRPAARSSTTC